MTEIAANVQAVLEATKNEEPEIRAAAAGGAASIPAPAGAAVSWLWKALVLGLVAILVIAVAGVIWTVVDGNADTTPDVLVTIFTSALTGLIGLFVRSPGQ
jgi:di/tricarboxylate transporter